MAGISDTTENAILNLIFSATTWANYAQNASTTPETNIVVGLHTADPGDAGTMATSETAYPSYARQNVARSTGWSTASGTAGSISPVANITFPQASGATSDLLTFFSTGKSGGGAAAILWCGALATSIQMANAVTPQLTTATTITLT